MEHRQVELFLAVADRLNVTEAAEMMGMTQPGLTKSMTRLQQEFGATLYRRRGRGIELTEAGRALLRHCKLIEAQMHEANVEVAGIARGTTGQVRIGAGPSWISRYLPDSIAAIMPRHPGLRFTVRGGFSEQLIRQLRLGELDVVVGALPDNRVDPDLQFTRLTSDTIRVVAREGHALLAKPDRSLADYAAQRWILPGRNELVRRRLARAFWTSGLPEPLAAVEADSLSMILAMLRLTDCLGLTTTQILAQGDAYGIVPVDHDQLSFSREAGIIIRRHAELPRPVKLLTTALRGIARQRANLI